jgi:hypothetical protein
MELLGNGHQLKLTDFPVGIYLQVMRHHHDDKWRGATAGYVRDCVGLLGPGRRMSNTQKKLEAEGHARELSCTAGIMDQQIGGGVRDQLFPLFCGPLPWPPDVERPLFSGASLESARN